jgi:hypothetical protein
VLASLISQLLHWQSACFRFGCTLLGQHLLSLHAAGGAFGSSPVAFGRCPVLLAFDRGFSYHHLPVLLVCGSSSACGASSSSCVWQKVASAVFK